MRVEFSIIESRADFIINLFLTT